LAVSLLEGGASECVCISGATAYSQETAVVQV